MKLGKIVKFIVSWSGVHAQGRGKYGLILKMYQLLDSILLPYIFEKNYEVQEALYQNHAIYSPCVRG